MAAKYTISKIFKIINAYAACILAGLVYSAAIKYFVYPSQVIMTGTEGISIATSYYFENQKLFIWLYLIFQAILIIFAFCKIGARFAIRTMIVIGTVVGMLAVLPDYQFAGPEPQNERMILVIFGGILAGLAKAIAFRYGASTGDEDIPSAYLSMKYLKPVGNIAVIAAVMSTLFGLILAFVKTWQIEPVINTLMYTTIYIFMSSETLNNFYRKFKLVLVNIITRNPNRIGEDIRAMLPHRTFTREQGIGGYSDANVNILRAIVTQEELPDVIKVIEKADKTAFFFYNDIEGVSKHYYISPIR